MSLNRTLNTRYGKLRTATQRRYVLVQSVPAYYKVSVRQRSDTVATLHTAARRLGAQWDSVKFCWSRGDGSYLAHYVVFDTVTGVEVPV